MFHFELQALWDKCTTWPQSDLGRYRVHVPYFAVDPISIFAKVMASFKVSLTLRQQHFEPLTGSTFLCTVTGTIYEQFGWKKYHKCRMSTVIHFIFLENVKNGPKYYNDKGSTRILYQYHGVPTSVHIAVWSFFSR